jgi:hypothetical protein
VVASLLGSYPLVLIQAGVYVSRGDCTLAEYPRVYERQRKRLLELRPAQAQSRYQDVYATFEASADILAVLMQIDADAWDSFRLIEAIHLLQAFSLVSTDTHSGYLSVSMHPLIHAWARDRQDADRQHHSWLTAGCLAAMSRDMTTCCGRNWVDNCSLIFKR